MSYMRGERYVWTDTENWLHIWARDGYDAWDDTLWACDEEDGSRRPGYEEASGVSLPLCAMDEFVVMRLAQMIAEGTVGDAIDRAVANHGNFGGKVLEDNVDVLKAALSQIELSESSAG